MMNIVERIVIERNGVILARINMLDANDRVINTIKTSEMLAYDDYTIDRETIAELCGMTLDTLNRFYHLDCAGYSKVIDYGVILTEAEFTKKDEFEILLDAIQNGDIKIADDEPEEYEDYEDYEEYENNNMEDNDMKIYNNGNGIVNNRTVTIDGKIMTITNNGPTLENYIKTDSGYYENYVIDDLFADGGIYYDCVIGTGDNTGGTFNHCEFVELIASGGVYSYCYVGSGGRLVGGTYNDCELCNVTYDSDKCIFNDCRLVNCTDIKPVKNNNNNSVIAKIQEQMVKAIEECDFETYDKLEERLNRLNK